MKLGVIWIQAKPGKYKLAATQALTSEYVKRISRYTMIETQELANESLLFKVVEKSRSKPFLVTLDSRGQQLSSEELAEFLDSHQTRGTQQLWFAVGGADGFSKELRSNADFQLSLGKMTLPHELARVVLLEQVYRAFTILKGHPYHTGH